MEPEQNSTLAETKPFEKLPGAARPPSAPLASLPSAQSPSRDGPEDHARDEEQRALVVQRAPYSHENDDHADGLLQVILEARGYPLDEKAPCKGADYYRGGVDERS